MVAVVDLFAGIGGLSIGAQLAGGDVRVQIDNDPIACSTLRLNPEWSQGRVVEADVGSLTGQQLRELAGVRGNEPLVVVGGPPCQPFSKNAYWTDPGDESRFRRARSHGLRVPRPERILQFRRDDRRSLVQEFWRVIEEAHADGFLFENVPSILHPRNRAILDCFQEKAIEAGYHVTLVKANAVDFGVPQRRHRVFVLAAKTETPRHPAPTHASEPCSRKGLLPVITSGQALAQYSDSRFFEPEEVVTGRWAEHLKSVPPGWNYKAHTAWAGHPSPSFETETRFWNFLLKLSPELPSWTIAANPGPWTGPFHWESRRLRTPELGALQALPDGYRFAGNRRERVRQIGNAVPPLLAQRMIEPILELFQ